MAKKIRIDFSKVEDRSNWNTRQMPEGLHMASIVSVEQTEAQDGTDMLVYGLKPVDNKYRSRLFPYYCKLQTNQYWKLRDLFIAAGQSIGRKVVNIDPEKIIGANIAIEVEDDSYDGKIRSTVQGTYNVNILEDEEGDLEADEEDDLEDEYYEVEEEVEEDDYEDEEEDFEDEELDEEDEDDFDEDDDDFDEDDLDDFDDEEEEEEPPAPKRKKAPVKRASTTRKPPAKKPARRR